MKTMSTVSGVLTKTLKPSAEIRPSFSEMLWTRSRTRVLVATSMTWAGVKGSGVRKHGKVSQTSFLLKVATMRTWAPLRQVTHKLLQGLG